MSDPCMDEFYARIAHIEKARLNGMGFEAPGTLGRSYYTRQERRKIRIRLPLLRPVLALLIAGTVLKALFLHQIGAQAYEDRVARLMEGEGFDRIGGWLMQADPATLALAGQITALFEQYR